MHHANTTRSAGPVARDDNLQLNSKLLQASQEEEATRMHTETSQLFRVLAESLLESARPLEKLHCEVTPSSSFCGYAWSR